MTILLWLLLPFVIAAAAVSRGRSFLVWLVLGYVLSPLIAGILLVLLSDKGRRKPRGLAGALDSAANWVDAQHDAEWLKRLRQTELMRELCDGGWEGLKAKRAAEEREQRLSNRIARVTGRGGAGD